MPQEASVPAPQIPDRHAVAPPHEDLAREKLTPPESSEPSPGAAPQRPTAIRAATGLLISAGAILLVAYVLLAIMPSIWITGFLAYLLRPVSFFVTVIGMPLAGPIVKGTVMLLAAVIVGGYFLSAFLIFTGHRGARIPASLLCATSMLLFAIPGPLLFVPLLSLGGTFPIWLPSATSYMKDSAAKRHEFRAAPTHGWPSPAPSQAPVAPSQ